MSIYSKISELSYENFDSFYNQNMIHIIRNVNDLLTSFINESDGDKKQVIKDFLLHIGISSHGFKRFIKENGIENGFKVLQNLQSDRTNNKTVYDLSMVLVEKLSDTYFPITKDKTDLLIQSINQYCDIRYNFDAQNTILSLIYNNKPENIEVYNIVHQSFEATDVIYGFLKQEKNTLDVAMVVGKLQSYIKSFPNAIEDPVYSLRMELHDIVKENGKLSNFSQLILDNLSTEFQIPPSKIKKGCEQSFV